MDATDVCIWSSTKNNSGRSCIKYKSKDVGAGEKSRDRHLSWKELDQFSLQIKNAELPERIEAALWLLLSTGVRTIELRNAKVEYLDLKKKEWVIPTTKNSSEHLVHLSDFSMGVNGRRILWGTFFQALQ